MGLSCRFLLVLCYNISCEYDITSFQLCCLISVLNGYVIYSKLYFTIHGIIIHDTCYIRNHFNRLYYVHIHHLLKSLELNLKYCYESSRFDSFGLSHILVHNSCLRIRVVLIYVWELVLLAFIKVCLILFWNVKSLSFYICNWEILCKREKYSRKHFNYSDWLLLIDVGKFMCVGV